MVHPGAVFVVILGAAWIHPALSQNQAPVWNENSYRPLFNPGIQEGAPLETIVATLECNDPEGDPVMYYVKSGGDPFFLSPLSGVLTIAENITVTPEDSQTGIPVVFECIDLDSQNRPRDRPRTEARTKWSVNDINDKPPTFNTTNVEGYSYIISEDAPVNTDLLPPIIISNADYKQDNVVLKSLTFDCDGAEGQRTCAMFGIRYRPTGVKGQYEATIFLKGQLDYEEFPYYNSKLIAVDGQGAVPNLTGQTTIQINLRDAQDQLPEFTNPGLNANVNESVPVGTVIMDFAVSARDGDLGASRPIAMEILPDPPNPFRLTTPVLSTNVIESGVYVARLVVDSQLDRESLSATYALIIRATELDNTQDPPVLTDATATATYSVFVTDDNDNRPEFEESVITVNVTEFTNIDNYQPTTISNLHIICIDRDEGSNADYTVRIVNQTFPDAFSISPQRASYRGTAHLFLQVDDPKYMDHDVAAYRNQVVVLEAVELMNAGHSPSYCTVNIQLQDINDNRPTFPQRTYTLSVSEDVNSFPHSLYTFTVTDQDFGSNQIIRFSLDNSASDKFGINAVTGELSLLERVNYEENPVYVFLVVATDQGTVPRFSQAQVTVNVLDVNDMPPIFSQDSWQTSANETSLFFLNPITITATDEEDPNARITYRILSGQSPNNAFFINPNTGRLSLNERLDFDQTPVGPDGKKTGVFNLIVEASDNGVPQAQTATVPVIVRVIDENNHPPVVDPVFYTSKPISELAPPGTFVAQILGTDKDGGTFGQLSFRLGPGSSNNFQVNQSTGNVTVGQGTSFDYETTKSYTLTILATDGGAPQLTATATVFVEITDANNIAPTFPQYFYTRRVNDNTPVGTPVLDLSATDKDVNPNLVYRIVSGTFTASDGDGNPLRESNVYDFRNAFAIDSATGQIRVNSELDRNRAQDITFLVQVDDTNSENGLQRAEAQVTMIIEGDPDNTIVFDPIPVMFVDEDEDVGHTIVTLTARDPITGSIITNFEKLPGSSSFMNVLGGRVVLAQTLDYETVRLEHEVIVKALSGDGLRSATATVTVSVLDVNDNKPIFQQDPYFTTISENARFPDIVTKVSATDIDSSSFAPITYRITGGLDAGDFTLVEFSRNSGAEVLVAPGAKLDYNRRPVYNLVVEAIDNADRRASATRLTSSVILTINVIDENNNGPEFKDKYLRYVVTETAQIGQNITVVRANDKDVGENGRITYSLIASVDDTETREGLTLFGISSSQGRIFVIGDLLGKGGRTFKFVVQARDNGRTSQTGVMQLDIAILSTEDNDGNPKWRFPPVNTIGYAPEETPNYVVKDLVFDVSPQTGTNITFELSPFSEGYSNFRIDPLTGAITVVASLDREVKEQYEIIVFAQDTNDTEKYRSGRTFIIQLLDKNDNLASFTNPRGYAACGEPIDRPLVIPVPENNPPNVSFYQLRGCDPDSNVLDHNRVRYSLYTENQYCNDVMAGSPISVSPEGQLYSRVSLDYEQHQEFILCVQVQSTNSTLSATGRRKRAVDLTQAPNENDVAIILVQVVDINDNGPKFPRPNEYAVVYTSPPNKAVHILDAVDKDGDGYNRISYVIQSSVFYRGQGDDAIVVKEAFVLRGNRGQIYPAQPTYQPYLNGRFVLRILALDKDDNTKRDEQILIIYVYNRGDTMKLVLNQKPAQGVASAPSLIRDLNAVDTKYVLRYVSASENKMKNGVNLDKTDVCFVAIDTTTKKVMGIREVLSVLDSSAHREVLNNEAYEVEDKGKCFPSTSSEEKVKWRDLWWVLVAVAIFLFVCCLICVVLVCILYNNYKQYMETRKTYLVQQ